MSLGFDAASSILKGDGVLPRSLMPCSECPMESEVIWTSIMLRVMAVAERSLPADLSSVML
jgi:hypothetical protein